MHFDVAFRIGTMDLLQYTQSRSPELAEYIDAVAQSPLAFEGPHPIVHSSHNHVHLWKIEYFADRCDWTDVDFRVEVINYILERWRSHLIGLRPYWQRGYRIFVYEGLAPTISVVAETDAGFPYAYGEPVFVEEVRDVAVLYKDRNWKEHFEILEWEISENRLLQVIQKNHGSIGKSSANKLGLSTGKLRTLIINMGIGKQVNSVRKMFHRRPADFSREIVYAGRWRVFQRLLPARYH